MIFADPDKPTHSGGAPSIPALLDALRAIEPGLPPDLIDAEAFAGITSIAAHVPRVMASFGFECRLVADDPTVDLGLSVMPGNGGGRALAELDRAPDRSIALLDDERWARIQSFAESWSDPRSRLATWIPFLFMEFDAAAATTRVPVPSIFFALDTPLGGARDRDDAEERGPISAVRGASRWLAGRGLGPELDAAVVRAFRAMPHSGWVMHAAIMLGRGDEGVRLSASLPAAQVGEFLREIGGGDAPSDTEIVVRELGVHADPVQVDFDLHPTLGPRIGYGLRPHADGAWPDLLSRLVEAGWCSPRKRDALIGWPGALPATLDGNAHVLQRQLSHVKLATRVGAPTRAKAYLGVTPLRLADSVPSHAN